VDYESFITIVAAGAGTDRDGAERATRATLRTLGERIDREQARQLAAQLSPEVAPWVATTTPAERFDVDEFIRRVSEREGVDLTTAQRHVSAVFDALARAVTGKEWADVVAELPRGFTPLLPRGPYAAVVDAEAFLRRVAERSGLDPESARHATDAVLETLAERIAGGEVDDLIERLPIELHAPLKRGRVASGGQAKPIRLDKFVQRVAERERVGPIEAALHARAVFRALREAAGEKEFRDITVQLPEDYVTLLAR
jgi:uncharacterized protein (DUF2267 family)